MSKAGHGFTTNGGDQTVTMFDLKTLQPIKQIEVGPGLDGIMYDEPDDKIILTNLATTVYLSAASWCATVTFPSPPLGMKISFLDGSHPSASTRVPFLIDATTRAR